MAVWYVRDGASIGWSAVTAWAASTSKAPGSLIRQLATPTVGSERVFVATQAAAGNTAGSEPTWIITKGGKTTDNAVTWQECTGQPGVNGDLTNTPAWLAVKNTAVALGQIIKNSTNAQLFICSVAGTAGNGAEPTWNTTAGNTTTDNTITWVCLGNVATFTNWRAPFPRIGNAIAATWAAAGDIIYAASDHIESQTATTLTWNAGTGAAPVMIYSIASATIPPVAISAGATINALTTSQVAICTTTNACMAFYGININCGSASQGPNITLGGNAVSGPSAYFEGCTLQLAGVNGSQRYALGSVGNSRAQSFIFENCTFLFTATAQSFNIFYANVEFRNCRYAPTGSLPATLFSPQTSAYQILAKGCDFSTITGNITSLAVAGPGNIILRSCRMNATYSASTGTNPSYGTTQIRVQNSDSAATNYRDYIGGFAGVLQASITISRANGASDGTNSFSWSITSSANAKTDQPFETEDIIVWNDNTGSLTATLYFTANSAGLNNSQVWAEVEYLGNASYPLGTLDVSSKSNYISTSSIVSDGSSWTGGLGNNYAIAVPITPGMKGPIRARLCVGQPSLQIAVDPQLVLT